jgi:hypothetical protein
MSSLTLTAPPSWALPRSAHLTDLLLEPAPARCDDVDRDEIRSRLAVRLAGVTPGSPLRVDGRLVRAANQGGSWFPPAPFEWSARPAGRVLGLAALRECAADPRLTPAQAARNALRTRRSGRPAPGWNGSLDRWLASLSPGGRRAVLVEALDWVTAVHSALDWGRIGPDASVGGSDLWWNSSHRQGVGVRARAELRLAVPRIPDEGGRGRADRVGLVLFCVLPGWSGTSSQAELCVTALGHILAPAAPTTTVRVVGWWPQSGQALALTVDPAAISEGIDTVVRTVAWARGHDR